MLMRPIRSVCLLTIALYAALPAFTPTNAAADAPDSRPIVVLREDDIRASWRIPFPGLGGMTGLQYGKLKRIPITWGVITDFATSGWGLTWAELKDYIDTAGGELASHSKAHEQMPDANAYISELVNSKAVIEQNAPGYGCTTFLQPGTWRGDGHLDNPLKLDNAVGQALQATYSQSQAYLGRGWQVGRPHYRYGIQANWSLDYDSPTVEAVQAVLDLIASTPGLVFVFTCHGLRDRAGGGDSLGVWTEVMKAFMDRAAELRDQGRIRLVSMHDAYNTDLPENLNRLVDPDFETPPLPATSRETWQLTGGASIVDGGGIGGSRGCVIPQNGQIGMYDLIVPPGRYRLSWKQMLEGSAQPPKDLRCYVENKNSAASGYVVYGPQIFTSTPDTWEPKSVLLLVKDRFPNLRFYYACISTATFHIDDLALMLSPLDPATSATSASATPSPNACTVRWRTPDSPDTEFVDIRLHNRTHPQSNTDQEGTLFARVPAVPGTVQEVTQPINWSQQSPGVFFSVFAVKNNGVASEPDIAVVSKDNTAPSTPQVSCSVGPGASVTASWSSVDAESGIYQYRYAVGTSSGGEQVVPWTVTAESGVVLCPLPSGIPLYLSVQAQNPFGLWSPIASSSFRIDLDVATALGMPDGTMLGVSGTVTAVFSDCCYIQQIGLPRGLRVTGCQNCVEGQKLSVSGTLVTTSGERALAVSP
jgi:hypothetical protein